MTWHPMKPETIERRKRELAEERKAASLALRARIQAAISEGRDPDGDYAADLAQWDRTHLPDGTLVRPGT